MASEILVPSKHLSFLQRSKSSLRRLRVLSRIFQTGTRALGAVYPDVHEQVEELVLLSKETLNKILIVLGKKNKEEDEARRHGIKSVAVVSVPEVNRCLHAAYDHVVALGHLHNRADAGGLINWLVEEENGLKLRGHILRSIRAVNTALIDGDKGKRKRGTGNPKAIRAAEKCFEGMTSALYSTTKALVQFGKRKLQRSLLEDALEQLQRCQSGLCNSSPSNSCCSQLKAAFAAHLKPLVNATLQEMKGSDLPKRHKIMQARLAVIISSESLPGLSRWLLDRAFGFEGAFIRLKTVDLMVNACGEVLLNAVWDERFRKALENHEERYDGEEGEEEAQAVAEDLEGGIQNDDRAHTELLLSVKALCDALRAIAKEQGYEKKGGERMRIQGGDGEGKDGLLEGATADPAFSSPSALADSLMNVAGGNPAVCRRRVAKWLLRASPRVLTWSVSLSVSGGEMVSAEALQSLEGLSARFHALRALCVRELEVSYRNRPLGVLARCERLGLDLAGVYDKHLRDPVQRFLSDDGLTEGKEALPEALLEELEAAHEEEDLLQLVRCLCRAELSKQGRGEGEGNHEGGGSGGAREIKAVRGLLRVVMSALRARLAEADLFEAQELLSALSGQLERTGGVDADGLARAVRGEARGMLGVLRVKLRALRDAIISYIRGVTRMDDGEIWVAERERNEEEPEEKKVGGVLGYGSPSSSCGAAYDPKLFELLQDAISDQERNAGQIVQGSFHVWKRCDELLGLVDGVLAAGRLPEVVTFVGQLCALVLDAEAAAVCGVVAKPSKEAGGVAALLPSSEFVLRMARAMKKGILEELAVQNSGKMLEVHVRAARMALGEEHEAMMEDLFIEFEGVAPEALRYLERVDEELQRKLTKLNEQAPQDIGAEERATEIAIASAKLDEIIKSLKKEMESEDFLGLALWAIQAVRKLRKGRRKRGEFLPPGIEEALWVLRSVQSHLRGRLADASTELAARTGADALRVALNQVRSTGLGRDVGRRVFATCASAAGRALALLKGALRGLRRATEAAGTALHTAYGAPEQDTRRVSPQAAAAPTAASPVLGENKKSSSSFLSGPELLARCRSGAEAMPTEIRRLALAARSPFLTPRGRWKRLLSDASGTAALADQHELVIPFRGLRALVRLCDRLRRAVEGIERAVGTRDAFAVTEQLLRTAPTISRQLERLRNGSGPHQGGEGKHAGMAMRDAAKSVTEAFTILRASLERQVRRVAVSVGLSAAKHALGGVLKASARLHAVAERLGVDAGQDQAICGLARHLKVCYGMIPQRREVISNTSKPLSARERHIMEQLGLARLEDLVILTRVKFAKVLGGAREQLDVEQQESTLVSSPHAKLAATVYLLLEPITRGVGALRYFKKPGRRLGGVLNLGDGEERYLRSPPVQALDLQHICQQVAFEIGGDGVVEEEEELGDVGETRVRALARCAAELGLTEPEQALWTSYVAIFRFAHLAKTFRADGGYFIETTARTGSGEDGWRVAGEARGTNRVHPIKSAKTAEKERYAATLIGTHAFSNVRSRKHEHKHGEVSLRSPGPDAPMLVEMKYPFGDIKHANDGCGFCSPREDSDELPPLFSDTRSASEHTTVVEAKAKLEGFGYNRHWTLELADPRTKSVVRVSAEDDLEAMNDPRLLFLNLVFWLRRRGYHHRHIRKVVVRNLESRDFEYRFHNDERWGEDLDLDEEFIEHLKAEDAEESFIECCVLLSCGFCLNLLKSGKNYAANSSLDQLVSSLSSAGDFIEEKLGFLKQGPLV